MVSVSMRFTYLSIVVCFVFSLTNSKSNAAETADYGVDVSFPIHRYIQDKTSVHYKRYQATMESCYKAFSKGECDATEHARMAMNLAQPKMQHNYTEIGFKKTRVPEDLFKEILQFFEENKEKEKVEDWPRGNTYVNNWQKPSYMINFEDRSLRGGWDLKQRIWNGIKPIIAKWTGKELTDTSLYGIRIYKEGAILATHVDRLPLVSSCIIQVAQDIDEPWPVEVISHDGKAHNVSMVPGDMVLYESHSVLHGRPFPLIGRYYANIFVHFIPVDHDDENEKDAVLAKLAKPSMTDRVKSAFSFKKKQNIGGHEQDNHDEDEVRHHRDKIDKQLQDEAEDVADEEPEGGVRNVDALPDTADGKTALHMAAAEGDLEAIQAILKSGESGSVSGSRSANYDMVHARDANDWQAIHEAAAAGHLEVVKFLIENGADLNALTKDGGTVLWWAKRVLEVKHPVIVYLEEIGAPDAASPESE